jgi:hypothetical protein
VLDVSQISQAFTPELIIKFPEFKLIKLTHIYGVIVGEMLKGISTSMAYFSCVFLILEFVLCDLFLFLGTGILDLVG